MALGRAQVGEWLRSMNLERHLQSFIDNGYDDMCVCRQIGDPDLDAIGVVDDADRRAILDSIRALVERDTLTGASGPVYYTLENPEYDEPPTTTTPTDSDESPGSPPPSPPPRTYQTARRAAPSGPQPLAPEEPRKGEARAKTGESFATKAAKGPEEQSEGSARGRSHGDGAVVVVVPSNSYHGTPSQHLSGIRSGDGFSDDKPSLSGGVSLEALNTHTAQPGYFVSDTRPSHKIPTLSKLFRLKHSKSPKYSYRPHEGDLIASEITMSESQRIKLMLQVKQGKMSQEDAIQQVKLYEEHKRFCTPQRDITPSHSFEGTFNVKDSDTKSQKHGCARPKSSVLRSKLQHFFHLHHAKQTIGERHSDAEKLPCTASSYDAGHFSEEQPRRGSLPTQCLSSQQDASTETFDDWPDKRAPAFKKLYPPDEFELSSGYKESRSLKQHSLRRCQEDNVDLNSDGMSQGESERTASSSLESVHSYSGVPSLSSSSSQGSVTLDDHSLLRQPACLARVLVDCIPSPYDSDALKLKKGDIIQVLRKDITGTWLGKIDNRIGNFKFINVELLPEGPSGSVGTQDMEPVLQNLMRQGQSPNRDGQSMVEVLLNSLHLQHLSSVFLLNGYITLDDMKSLTEKDLDELNVWKVEDRSKVMAAIELIRSGQVLFKEKSEKKPMLDGEVPASGLDSSGSAKGDALQRHCESKIPSPIIRKGHTLAGRKASHKELYRPKQKESGYDDQTDSVVIKDKEIETSVKDDVCWSGMMDPGHPSLRRHDPVSRHMTDCDNFSLGAYRYRTFSDGHRTESSARTGRAYSVQSRESQTGGPRNRTNSLDQSMKRLPKKSPQSWHHSLTSAIDSAYSSAPSTPVLRRSGTRDRSVPQPPELVTQDPSCSLAAMYPHLAGVKTAHIRSLNQSISRSAPASPAAIPRITPATRSSIHAHPRAGKPPRLRPKGALSEQRPSQGKQTSQSAKSQDIASASSILKAIGLSQYEVLLKSHGIITCQHFMDLKEKDLLNMGIKNMDHLQRLLLWQQHVDLGDVRLPDVASTSRGHQLSDLRDKV